MEHRLLSRALLSCVVAACGEPSGVDDPAETLIVDWTIKDGDADCDGVGAQIFSGEIRALHGDFVSRFSLNCDAFSKTVLVYPDEYEGEAVLRAGFDTLTREVPLSFSVSEGRVTSVLVDFSSDTFL